MTWPDERKALQKDRAIAMAGPHKPDAQVQKAFVSAFNKRSRQAVSAIAGQS